MRPFGDPKQNLNKGLLKCRYFSIFLFSFFDRHSDTKAGKDSWVLRNNKKERIPYSSEERKKLMPTNHNILKKCRSQTPVALVIEECEHVTQEHLRSCENDEEQEQQNRTRRARKTRRKKTPPSALTNTSDAPGTDKERQCCWR